jgi:acyl-CoA thioester hydrolase
MKNSFDYRVYYEDTDAGGVVYYANYLKFFERARTDLLRNKGIIQSKLLVEEKIAFVVKKCEVEYLFPAKMDDLLEVVSVIVKMLNASFVVEQQIFKKDQNKIICKMKVEIVSVSAEDFKPKKIPENIKKILINS